MKFKKALLSCALVSMAGLVACGGDSSSGSDTKELPKSVKTFMDLGDVECNAERKCEKILVEEHGDTYQCDGVQQWDMLMDGIPSKVCPAENEMNTEGDDNGLNNVDSSDSNGGTAESSADSDATSSDSENSTGDSSASDTGSSDSNTAASSESAAKAKVSCDNISEEGQTAFLTMGEKCIEVEAGTINASALELRCEDYGGTLGTGCPAKEAQSNDNCIDKTQCDALVRGDVSTWHFVRADAFGNPTTYTYSVDGSTLILDIDGKKDDSCYSFYDMTSDVGKEMAFSAAKSTCKNGMEIEGANYCE